MKINEITEDISRRGFLKGAAAAAASAATGAIAAPFSHNQTTDQMDSSAKPKKYSQVKSEDGSALLEIHWPESGKASDMRPEASGAVIGVPGQTLDLVGRGTAGRIKFGSSPPLPVTFSSATSGNYSIAWIHLSTAKTWDEISKDGRYQLEGRALARKLLTFSGEVKIEVPIYRVGNKVFTFKIEPDDQTKKLGTNEEQVEEDATPDAINDIVRLSRNKR